MTEPHGGCSGSAITTLVAHTTHANGFVAAGLERCWSRTDPHETHDVFIVISESRDGEHTARTFYAADEDDARQTHHENYTDEPIIDVRPVEPR